MKFSGYQKLVVALLSFLQFTVILDFMILSPLGAILMPALKITPSQFGLVVSVYAFSAGSAGLLTAGFADKFDRKKLLLFFYSGFLLGTLLCGLATSYHLLVVARVITGLFGGVIGAIVLSITTDLFPLSMRGQVMGFIQTAFAASQILGLPAGLFLANHWGWHIPFFLIVGVGSVVGIIIFRFLEPVDSHLKNHPDRKPFHHLIQTVSTPRYLFAFSTTTLLSLGGYMLMPFGSAFTVHNLGIELHKLPTIYFISGCCTLLFGPLIGKISDRVGKYPTFVFGSVFGMVMVLIYTNLGVTPLYQVILVNALMFFGIFSRMIPAQALMSAVPDPLSRGAFMSINSSMQHMAGGCASILAGLIIVQKADGSLEHFNTLGHILVATSMGAVVMIYFINKIVKKNLILNKSS